MVPYTFLFVISQALILVSQSQEICNRDISILHGQVDYGHRHYEVICDPGYLLDGSRVVLCEDNEWKDPKPSCIEGKCELPQPLKHGTVLDCTSQDLPRINDKCRFRCNIGYKLRGPSSLTCTAPGIYVDEDGNENFPECVVDDEYRQKVATHRIHNQGTTRVYGEKASPVDLENNLCKNSGCQHICKNDGKCRCRKNYTLAPDGKTCIETESVQYQTPSGSTHRNSYNTGRPASNSDPCYNNKCEQLCQVENGRAQCRCNRGFLLNQEDQRSCNKNLGPPVHRGNSCGINNGGCEHICTTAKYGAMRCKCRDGYDLADDKKTCIRIPDPPVDPGNSCGISNGGCEHICTPGWFGAVKCKCRDGYGLAEDKKTCILSPTRPPRLTCDVNNGGCQHRCSMRRNNPECSCPFGYRLHSDRKSCVDIDECKHERLNRCHHICENTEGSYTCSCYPGYTLTENNKCEGCKKNSYWSTEELRCVNCPENSHTLSDGKTSLGDCICNPGFNGRPVEGVPCLDVDECSSDNFGCSHTCTNNPGGAFCSCPSGYKVDRDNKTCIDIDECRTKNGGCEGTCFNTDGSFYCKCLPGFVPSNKDKYSCDDVDECAVNNGGCQQLCVNYRGGYNCACERGYRLDSSLKNCTDIACPALPIPHFSSMRCKKDVQVLENMDNYPTGTVCSFKCMTGFKDASESNNMKCQEDGQWEGSLSECKSQRCPPLKVPENGDVHPSSCATDGNTVKQKCTFTCRRGFKLVGISIFVCRNNLTWNKPMENVPVCQPEGIRASVECTRDVTATLLPGNSRHNVTIPEPVTNMESYKVIPQHIVVGKPMEFEAGKTNVLFEASSPSSNRTATCMTTVHVIDKEQPVFLSCPDSILVEDAKLDGETVTWKNPEVHDNVGVKSLKSSVEPNTTLTPGSYVVQYVARDAAGNTASCSFEIDIVRLSCDNLTDPANGQANCMDWLYGYLCQPECDEGYIRDPSEPLFYSCGDSGVWEPGEKISDCLPFTKAVASQCPDKSELKIIEETDEEICLECPPSTIWSSKTRKCEK